MVSYPIYGLSKKDKTLIVGSIDLDTGVIVINLGFHDVRTYMTSDGQNYTALNFAVPQEGDIPTIDDQFQSTNNQLFGYARRSNGGKDIKISLLTEDFDPQLTYFVSLRALEKVRVGERAVTTILSSPIKFNIFMAAINKQNL